MISDEEIEFRKAIGRAVRAAREKAGLTLVALSADAGLQYSTLAGVELGRMAIVEPRLSTIADALGVTLAAILRDSGVVSQSFLRD